MRHMLDAFALPAELPAVEVIAGYLVSPGTDADWPPEEWARARAHAQFIVPIWVAPGGQDRIAGTAHGEQTVHDCLNLGIAKGCVVVLDLEANDIAGDTESGYDVAWCQAVSEAGYRPVIYTSEAFAHYVEGHAELWLAKWDGQPALLPGSVMTQYDGGPGHAYDLSVVADDLPLSPTHSGGSPMPTPEHAPMWGIVPTHSGDGYWTFDSTGAVFAFGDAKFHGGANNPDVSHAGITGMAPTHDDGGYWLVAADGGVFAYGNAKWHGAVVNGVLKTP